MNATMQLSPEAQAEAAAITGQTPPEPTHKSVEIRVIVCPHPDCSNYYGASSMPERMDKLFSGPKVENRQAHLEKHGSKESKALADCPECIQRNRGRIARVPIVTRIQVPLWAEGTEPIPLPASS